MELNQFCLFLVNYPFDETYTHILGYVSEASEQDILDNEVIKNIHVSGLKIGKSGLEKSFENIFNQMVYKDMRLMHMEKELIKLTTKKVLRVNKLILL